VTVRSEVHYCDFCGKPNTEVKTVICGTMNTAGASDICDE